MTIYHLCLHCNAQQLWIWMPITTERQKVGAVSCTAFLQLILSFKSLIVVSIVENTVKVSPGLLKQLARKYEAGISIDDISAQIRIDKSTTKKLLKLLGYATA